MSEMAESEVRNFDNQATVQQTVGTLQTTVKLQRTFVNVFHSLTIPHLRDLNYTHQCIRHTRFTQFHFLIICHLNF